MKRGKANGAAVSNGNEKRAEVKNEEGGESTSVIQKTGDIQRKSSPRASTKDSVQHASNGHFQEQHKADKGKNKKKKGGGKFWNKFAGLVRSDVKTDWKDYDETFTQSNGEGIRDKEHTKDGVDTFYNLVTDIYEWGWGPSFHFSPQLKGKGVEESSIAHEIRISDTLGLRPGTMALDVGCGIGGPLITIASHSGAKIVGLTINKYQVERCKARAIKAGLRYGEDFDVLQGNFLDLQFPENSIDNAYAIEATCHSPDLAKAYSEIYRVLKPGGKFVNYEWVSTATHDENNPDHVKCIDDINYANALPEMRKYSEIAQVARQVGFEVLEERDLAAGPNANEWWGVLKTSMQKYKFNDILIKILSFLRILPKVSGRNK